FHVARQGHLTTVEVRADCRAERLGDERRGDSAEQTSALARLHLDASRCRLDLAPEGECLVAIGDLAGLAGLPERVDLLLRTGRPRSGQTARDEEVASVACTHLDDVTGSAETVDFLIEDELP